jgi:TRAP-type C4-dicarboxylate transport system permease small subunit
MVGKGRAGGGRRAVRDVDVVLDRERQPPEWPPRIAAAERRGAFIVQIVFRYLLNYSIGWTSELTVITWLWLVLWGAAFVVREREEIRFDLVYGAAGLRLRRIMAAISAIALLVLYGMSLPAVVDYVTFMKVQSTAYLKIRFDLLFSIYVVFAVAILIRYAWILWDALRGSDPGTLDQDRASSGL